MKPTFLIITTTLLTACMRPDYPDAPTMITDESEGIITITQVINSKEVLADYSYNGTCTKKYDNNFICENLNSYNFGHFYINAKGLADGDKIHVEGVKKGGVYRYTNTLGSVKTIQDYTINNNFKIETNNKKAMDKYNADFPKDEQKDYQSIFYFGKEIRFWNIISPVVYTPLSLIFSPICLVNDKCYITLNRLSDEAISTPYKDRK